MGTNREAALAKARELHVQYAQTILQAAAKVADQVLELRPPDGEKELNARRWALLRVVLLDGGFTYTEAVVVAKALAQLATSQVWPADAQHVIAIVNEQLVGTAPKEEANLYGLMVLTRKLASRLTGSPYDSHEMAVLSISRRLRSFIRQCEAQGIPRDAVAQDIAASAELQPEMVYRVETAGKRITAPMLLRLDRALRRAEMEAASG